MARFASAYPREIVEIFSRRLLIKLLSAFVFVYNHDNSIWEKERQADNLIKLN